MRRRHSNAILCLIPLVALCGCTAAVPAVLGVDTISPLELGRSMESGQGPYIIDVRPEERYVGGHIGGAIRVPSDSVYGYLVRTRLQKDQGIVFVCNRGVLSADAAVVAKGLGFTDVKSLDGGMQGWNLLKMPVETGPGIATPPDLLKPVEIALSRFEQLLQTLSGFLIKPAHMTLALAIIIVLWRRRDGDLALIRTGLLLMLAGESLCALNFFISTGTSVALDLAHDAGMIAVGALLPWGFLMMLDERLIHFFSREDPCLVQRFCGRCAKLDESAPCGPVTLFEFATLAAALLSTAPLLEPLHPLNMVMPVYGTEVCYMSSIGLQFALFRVYPIAAVLLFLASFVILKGGRGSVESARLPFFLGAGFASFSIFRFFLYGGYRLSPGWTLIWEEVTELLTILGVAIVLWTFRKQLKITLSWKSRQ